ncbi:MAG: TolC family protein [Alphaproteobacteria bacterium]
MQNYKKSAVAATALILLLLNGCAPSSTALKPGAVGEMIGGDLTKLYHQEDKQDGLKFEDAIARALRYNLDARVAAYEQLAAHGAVTLERLNALPAMEAKWNYITRSNKGAGSSLSVITNTQSLEPSISTPQSRTTAQLEMNWNLLDAALAVARSRSASDRALVAEERRRKVFQNVVQDVYSAYWRAAAAQTIRGEIAASVAETDVQIGKIDEAMKRDIIVLGDARRIKGALLEKKQQMKDLNNQLALADTALKALIGLPPRAKITLDPGDVEWMAKERLPKVNRNISDLETMALLSRPEVHEEILNKGIALRDVKMEMLATLPGASIFLAFNHDNNDFLVDKNWLSLTGTIAQSITKILTAPARIGHAKTNVGLADARRQALLAAVITQVHVAKMRFDQLADSYDTVVDIESNKKAELVRARSFRDTGMMSNTELAQTEVDATLARANRAIAYAAAQEAYGQLLNTLGVDLWSSKTGGMTVPQLAGEVKRKLNEFEDEVVGEEAPAGKGDTVKS